MKDLELLQLMYKNAEMGRDGLDKLIERTDDRSLRREMANQYAQYQEILNETSERLGALGKRPEGSDMASKAMAGWMTRMQIMMDDSSSKMAEMLIEGSTQGVIKLTQELHEYEGEDEKTREIAHKLIDTEQANIEKLRHFL